MITIGKTYVAYEDNQARLCADISVNDRHRTIWFGVERDKASWLTMDRSDPFVLAMLPTAMRKGYDLRWESPVSERLRYQLQDYLIPTLTAGGKRYFNMNLIGETTNQPYPSEGAIVTAFSGGVDSLYTIMRHETNPHCTLTHLAVFNVGVYEGREYQNTFRRACGTAAEFAEERGLQTVFLDSNLYEVLPEHFISVNGFRNLSGTLALQGLIGTYLLSSAFSAEEFQINLDRSAAYDLLLTNCINTETTGVYLSGLEADRIEKMEAIADWEPSHRWLSSCVYNIPGKKACGTCKKCIRDLLSFYAMGKLENYSEIYDLQAFRRSIPQKIGFIMAERNEYFSKIVLEKLEKSLVPIPPAAYVFEKQFTRALENLKEKEQSHEN